MERPRGFSLIDVLVGVSLLVIVFLALSATLRATIAVSALARAKSTSTGLAESEMEYLRGISYASLGTVNGTPTGIIPDDATSTVDGIPYGIHTDIVYNDDTDDYKIAEITITAYGKQAHSLSLVSSFAP